MFLGFANFYRKFIRNFSGIVASLISILQITNESIGDNSQSNQAENQDVAGSVGGTSGSRIGSRVGGSIKNLSTTAKSAKKPKSTKLKKSDSTKVKSSKRDFLTPRAKRSSYIYKKLLPKLQFLSILIQSVIFGLRLILSPMPLVEFLVK